MVRNNRQAAYERLIILAEKQGYVTFDNIADCAE
jgi:ABC-type xylose transport system substrate-binding protein